VNRGRFGDEVEGEVTAR